MDTWSEIREFQRRQRAVSARLRRRRKQRYENLAKFGISLALGRPSASPAPSVALPDHRGALDLALERRAVEQLLSPLLDFPLACRELSGRLAAPEEVTWELLQKLSGQELVELHAAERVVSAINVDKLSVLAEGMGGAGREEAGWGRAEGGGKLPHSVAETIERLLNTPSVREMESRKMGVEILELLNCKSVMEQRQLEKFQSAGGSQLQEFCSHKTRESCWRARGGSKVCGKLHFRKIIQIHTDESLGDCSFLNTCFHMDTCKFVHYEIDTQRARERDEVHASSNRNLAKQNPSLSVVVSGGES